MRRPFVIFVGLFPILVFLVAAISGALGQRADNVVNQIVATVCTNQFVRSIAATGLATCNTVQNADLANSATTVAGQTCTLGSTCGLTFVANSLPGDVLLNNTANYFDGPSTAQGTSGTWLATGSVNLLGTAADGIFCKLWDGTTVIDSRAVNIGGTGSALSVTLSGVLASPATNIKISCRDASNTTGKILFNISGNSKDGTLTVVRIQ